mmetsp:Transcript_10421/g.23565  ORF Transcript_10421/g.23565 Transcript_10421/m.23565 type:complete len:269 (-) Transcript_10421:1751-2557(-)
MFISTLAITSTSTTSRMSMSWNRSTHISRLLCMPMRACRQPPSCIGAKRDMLITIGTIAFMLRFGHVPAQGCTHLACHPTVLVVGLLNALGRGPQTIIAMGHMRVITLPMIMRAMFIPLQIHTTFIPLQLRTVHIATPPRHQIHHIDGSMPNADLRRDASLVDLAAVRAMPSSRILHVRTTMHCSRRRRASLTSHAITMRPRSARSTWASWLVHTHAAIVLHLHTCTPSSSRSPRSRCFQLSCFKRVSKLWTAMVLRKHTRLSHTIHS